ncbi:MAG: InlB B-repeat-containing protein, partial [Defluviitaleaceae bacterium]|nr:InlB B-repeat-containing protein [Defluviitaleaceae bacterium]
PQQITAQSENDPLTLSRISLEDRIEVAEALLRDTEVQENGKNTPSDKFWAPLEAHLALLNAINEAKALLAALQVHGLTIIAQDSDGQAIDQAEVTLTVDGVSTTHQAAMGIISVPEIPIGSTVILNAETEPDTPYAFLRWEVARGDVEISPFVPIPEIAMPYGMVVLYAIFEPTAEDTSWALLPVWDDNLADEPLEFTITEIGAYVDGFSEGVIVGKHSTDIEFTEHSESAEPPPYMPVDIEFTEYLELPPYEHEDYESHADYDDDIISAFDVRPVYPAAWNPNAFANSVIVDVDYGVPWSIELPSYAPWLTITNQRRNPPHTSDSFVINVLEHTGSSPRTAIVRLVLPYAFIEITVTQSSSAVLLVGTSSWTADASGDAIAIGVATTSNRRWEVTTNVPWLSLWDYEPSNRTGNGHFVIAADTHLGNASRMGLIIVTAGAATRTITVNQHPGAVLIVNTATATAGAWGGTSQPIDVISNRTWTVTSSSPSWLTATPASRTGNGSFTISAAMNAGLGTRTGIITVSTLGADSRSIIVTQESGGGLLLSWDEATAPADPSTGTVEVFSDRTWNMPTSNVSWLTVSNISPSHRTGNGSFAVNTSANLGNTARTGTITVTAGTTARTVRITQNTGGVLLLSWNTAEATAAPSYGILNVISNRAWSIHNGAAAWLSTTDITPTNQNGSGSFYINATENPSTSQRSGVIAVSSNGLSTQTARVVQAGQTAQISLAQNSWLPTSGASSTSLIVTSNTTWTATSNQSWLTLTPASRTGTGALTLVTSVNNSSTARTGTVTISANGAVSRTITVTQAGVTTFALNMNTWTPPSAAAFATVNVTASGTWNMPTSNASWLTISNITPTNRTGNGSFRINATANTSAAPRTGTITATLGGMTRTITVTQAAQAVQNPLNGVSWLMYYDSANNAEIYVTSAAVPSYGTFRNVYMGMLRNMSGGGQSGALYAQTTSGWVHVGDLTFSEGVGGLSEGEIGNAYEEETGNTNESETGSTNEGETENTHDSEITGFSQMTATVSGGGIFNFTRPTPLSTITNRPTLSGFFSWLFSYRITFDANGGTVGTGTSHTQTVPRQSGVTSTVGTLPPTPRRLGFDFAGWFTTPNPVGGTQVTENTVVTGNATYWARWNPQLTITSPTASTTINMKDITNNGGVSATWTTVPFSEYHLSLRNLATNELVIDHLQVGTTGFTIPSSYFMGTFNYRISVSVTPIGATTVWREVEFTVLAHYIRPVNVEFESIAGTQSEFGWRRSGGEREHAGIDFRPLNRGTVDNRPRVYAVADGTITRYAHFYDGTYALEVLNDDGRIVRYAEIASSLSVGSRVQQGDAIATIVPMNSGSMMLHLEYYMGTATGSLSQPGNVTTYDYVAPARYNRRRDLLDPTFFSEVEIKEEIGGFGAEIFETLNLSDLSTSANAPTVQSSVDGFGFVVSPDELVQVLDEREWDIIPVIQDWETINSVIDYPVDDGRRYNIGGDFSFSFVTENLTFRFSNNEILQYIQTFTPYLRTLEDMGVGDDIESVIATYGTGFGTNKELDNVIEYFDGNTYLFFIFEQGTVWSWGIGTQSIFEMRSS